MALYRKYLIYIALAGIFGLGESQTTTDWPYDYSYNETSDCLDSNDTYIMNCSSSSQDSTVITRKAPTPPARITEGPWCYHCAGDRETCLMVNRQHPGDRDKIRCNFDAGMACISMANRSKSGEDVNFITRTCTSRFDFMCTDRSGRVWTNDGLAELVCCAHSGCNTDLFLSSAPSVRAANSGYFLMTIFLNYLALYYQ